MKNWIKIIGLSLVVSLIFIKDVLAQTWNTSSGDEPAKFGDLEIIFENILGIIISLAGVAVFIMLIIGGFKYLTAGGNPEQAGKAKGVITWAIGGLIVILVAWFILRLITEVTGVDVTKFEIPTSVTNP